MIFGRRIIRRKNILFLVGIISAAFLIYLLLISFEWSSIPKGEPPPQWQGEPPSSCVDCHSNLSERLRTPVYLWNESIHKEERVGCEDCHGGDPTNPTISGSMSSGAGYIGIPDREGSVLVCG